MAPEHDEQKAPASDEGGRNADFQIEEIDLDSVSGGVETPSCGACSAIDGGPAA